MQRASCALELRQAVSLLNDSVCSECCFAWLHVFKHYPLVFPPSFHCLFCATGACLPILQTAHVLLSKICQPWERSPSRSWLPIVEALGYMLQAPHLHFSNECAVVKLLLCMQNVVGQLGGQYSTCISSTEI